MANEHMKKHHWSGVFIQLVIVVVGVFIGLQGNNWNQARADAAPRPRLRPAADP